MSAKPLYGRFDVIDLLQDIMSDYPGSKIFGHFEPDPNEFRVHIEYLGETDNLKIDASMLGYRDFIAEVKFCVTDSLAKMELDNEQYINSPADSMFKRLFDICKTYDASVAIRLTRASDDICCVRVLKNKQALDYLIDLDEIAQSVVPIDEAFINRIDMAAKELSNNIHGFDLGSVDELTIKEENVT